MQVANKSTELTTIAVISVIDVDAFWVFRSKALAVTTIKMNKQTFIIVTMVLIIGLSLFERRDGNFKLITAKIRVIFDNRLYDFKNDSLDCCK